MDCFSLGGMVESTVTFSCWFDNFIDKIPYTIGDDLYRSLDEKEYLIQWLYIMLNKEYYACHTHILDKINLHNYSKDATIIDIGTGYGIIPYALKQYGFNNVNSTDIYGFGNDLTEMWKILQIEPKYFVIDPLKKFMLDKKYNLILMLNADLHKNKNRWSEEIWEVFINQIKKQLEKDGKAIINPDEITNNEIKFLNKKGYEINNHDNRPYFIIE